MDSTQKNRNVPIKKDWGEKSSYMLMFSQVVSTIISV